MYWEYSIWFYVPERSIMHFTVSARFLISSGREGEYEGDNGRGGLYGPRAVM